jgi:CheY-like chemotaxis protein
MAPYPPATILVIDDEPSVVRALAGLLRRDGYRVSTASNGRHALAQLQVQPYDVIVCDLRASAHMTQDTCGKQVLPSRF